jgi:hypothetical protein
VAVAQYSGTVQLHHKKYALQSGCVSNGQWVASANVISEVYVNSLMLILPCPSHRHKASGKYVTMQLSLINSPIWPGVH